MTNYVDIKNIPLRPKAHWEKMLSEIPHGKALMLPAKQSQNARTAIHRLKKLGKFMTYTVSKVGDSIYIYNKKDWMV